MQISQNDFLTNYDIHAVSYISPAFNENVDVFLIIREWYSYSTKFLPCLKLDTIPLVTEFWATEVQYRCYNQFGIQSAPFLNLDEHHVSVNGHWVVYTN